MYLTVEFWNKYARNYRFLANINPVSPDEAKELEEMRVIRDVAQTLHVHSQRAVMLFHHLYDAVGATRLRSAANQLVTLWQSGRARRPPEGGREILIQLGWLVVHEFRHKGAPPQMPPPGATMVWKRVLAETPELSPHDAYAPSVQFQVQGPIWHVFHPSLSASIYDLRNRSIRSILADSNLSDGENPL